MKEKLYIQVKDHLLSQKTFSIVKNTGKPYLVTRPKPEIKDINNYYESKDYQSHKLNPKSIFEKFYSLFRNVMLIRKERLIRVFFKKPAEVLDIGSGTGDFLIYLKKRGWSVTGCEPSKKARAHTKQKIFYIDLEKKGIQKEFDLITLWHSIEHVYDLKKTVGKINAIIKQKGYLIVACPNYKSWDANYYQENWAAWDVPRHLRHFNKESIKETLTHYGFEEVTTKPLFLDSIYVSILSEKILMSNVPFIKGLFFGLVSNIVGLTTKNYSSHIYVFKKVNKANF